MILFRFVEPLQRLNLRNNCSAPQPLALKVGDHLSVRRRVADVYQKGISIDPEAVWIVAEAVITNQRDETVCLIRNTLLTHRTPAEVTAAKETTA